MISQNFEPFLESKKIFLTIIDEEDIPIKYLKWINDQSIIGQTESRYFPTSKNKLFKKVKEFNESPNTVFFSIIDKKTKDYIGNVKIGPINWIDRNAAIGRLIGEKDFHGKGYGTEVSKLILKYAFQILNLNKIYSGAIESNKGSIKSNLKLGFKIEGELREHYYLNGSYKSLIQLGLTKKDYAKNLIDNPLFEE
jgi:[ribosomal protein S5]-alanine N-acetyltransferase